MKPKGGDLYFYHTDSNHGLAWCKVTFLSIKLHQIMGSSIRNLGARMIDILA
jgi:hypothetical protein